MHDLLTEAELLSFLAGQEGEKRFLLFVGLPGSGKSDLSKKLVKRGVKRLCIDRLQKRNPALAIQPYLLLVRYYQLLEAALKAGRRVVDDNPNLSAASRQKALKLARAAGYEVVIVHMDTPLEICLKRNSNRSRVVPDDVVLQMWRDFAKGGQPRPSEGRIVQVISSTPRETLYEVMA